MRLARSTAVGIAVAAGSGLFAAPAHADRGRCDLDARKASGTYGFAAQGEAIGANPFVPVGPFSQAGTVTLAATAEDASTITGTWSVKLAQNDSSGYTPNVTFGGTFQVDRASCSGDFFVAEPVQIAEPSFRVVFVDGGEEVRTIAAIPKLIVSYSTAKKL
ncbi:MAG TPA: hypothetical protein VJ779_19915 [Acetobacteraceae bacterium]|nr:hypothetical protein [Acetobacteraceae bacterium]